MKGLKMVFQCDCKRCKREFTSETNKKVRCPDCHSLQVGVREHNLRGTAGIKQKKVQWL
jgi:Zn finger protein HypA/HybF involved in hydrogenase expression